MQDIRKPYSRSRSNRVLDARVAAFEKKDYSDSDAYEKEIEELRASPRHGRHLEPEIALYPKKEHYMRPPRKGRSKEMWVLSILFAAVVLFVGLYTYVFDSAVVTITPKYADMEVNKTVHFRKEGVPTDKSADTDVSFILATTTLEKTKDLPKTESKKVESKAEGHIIVYNNYDENPQRLLKNTRFESSDGKIYRINTSVTVPGKKGTLPGSIEVVAYADSYGEDYNIPPSDFTIPGFKGTPRYKAFYGRSNGPMTGGASGDKKLVSISDLSAVKDEFALSLTQDIKNQMKQITKEGFVPLSNDVQVTFADNEKDILTGQTSQYHVVATGYLVLAKQEEVAHALAKTLSQYNNEPLRLDHAENLSFALKEGTDISKDTDFDVFLDGTPRVVWKVNETQLQQMLSGKSKTEFSDVLHSFSSIQKAEMSLSPLWISHFPDDSNKIEVKEKLPLLSK